MVTGTLRPCNVTDLLTTGMLTGSSLILRLNKRLLYGVRRPREEDGRTVLELTGIGGKMEQVDTTLTACAQREAWEELGCGVRLLALRDTLVVRSPKQVQRVALRGEERPVAVVYYDHKAPPHQPWYQGNEADTCVVVFLAEIDGTPYPEAELPAMVWLSPEQAIRLAGEDVRLADLIKQGLVLEGQAPNLDPNRTWLRLVDSQQSLILALKDQALEYLQSLANG